MKSKIIFILVLLLVSDLATLAKNRIVPSTKDSVPFDLITTPTALQQRAFDLLHVNYRM